MESDIEAAIAEGYANRDRENMQPTIDYFQRLLGEHPGHPVLVYEVGGTYDTAGEEEKAVGYYEQALEAGLPDDVRRRCLIQYGSTLRNLDRFDDSLAALRRAREEFPTSAAIPLFVAMTLHAAGDANAAVAELIDLAADRIDDPDIARYSAGLHGNAEYLRTGEN